MKNTKRIAILSNVNITPIVLALQNDGLEVWEANGFGDIIGPLLDENAGLREFAAEEIYIIVDISALLVSALTELDAVQAVNQFTKTLEIALPKNTLVFISDVICPGVSRRHGIGRLKICVSLDQMFLCFLYQRTF